MLHYMDSQREDVFINEIGINILVLLIFIVLLLSYSLPSCFDVISSLISRGQFDAIKFVKFFLFIIFYVSYIIMIIDIILNIKSVRFFVFDIFVYISSFIILLVALFYIAFCESENRSLTLITLLVTSFVLQVCIFIYHFFKIKKAVNLINNNSRAASMKTLIKNNESDSEMFML